MNGRPIYRIASNSGTWTLSRNEIILDSFEDKTSAVRDAHRMAQAEEPSELIIHTELGNIEKEITYSQDPSPSRTVSRR